MIKGDIKLILFILSLGIDTFAVAIGLGLSGMGRKNRLRIGISFAFFEGLMPLVGFFIGQTLSTVLGDVASILGIIFLFGIGAWMIRESFTGEKLDLEIDSRKKLLLTSLSVSMDELAIGFSMGALGFPIFVTVILITLQAFVLTFIGTTFGNYLGEKLAERAERIAGIVLCGLAVVFILEKYLL